jgi:hypothetical protein
MKVDVSSTAEVMKITIVDRGRPPLRERLRERLERVAQLRCSEHSRAVMEVIIHGRENGWFDSRLIACCERLEQQAAAIVKERC